MYNSKIDFIEKYEVLYCYQFGVWKNYSTLFAITHLFNKISLATD